MAFLPWLCRLLLSLNSQSYFSLLLCLVLPIQLKKSVLLPYALTSPVGVTAHLFTMSFLCWLSPIPDLYPSNSAVNLCCLLKPFQMVPWTLSFTLLLLTLLSDWRYRISAYQKLVLEYFRIIPGSWYPPPIGKWEPSCDRQDSKCLGTGGNKTENVLTSSSSHPAGITHWFV